MTRRPRRGEMRRRSAVPTCPGQRPNKLRHLRKIHRPTLPRSLLVTSCASPRPSHPSVLPCFHDEHVVVHLGVCKRPAAQRWWHRQRYASGAYTSRLAASTKACISRAKGLRRERCATSASASKKVSTSWQVVCKPKLTRTTPGKDMPDAKVSMRYCSRSAQRGTFSNRLMSRCAQ